MLSFLYQQTNIKQWWQTLSHRCNCHIWEKAHACYWNHVVKSLLPFPNIFKMLILSMWPFYFSVRHHHTIFSQKWETQRHFGPINSRLMLRNRPAIHFLISTLDQPKSTKMIQTMDGNYRLTLVHYFKRFIRFNLSK